MRKLFVVVSYDVSDDKRLRRVSKELSRWGKRVQKSVFELNIKESDYLKLKRRLLKIIKLEEDSIRFYFLCKRCISSVEWTGKTPPVEIEDIDFEIV